MTVNDAPFGHGFPAPPPATMQWCWLLADWPAAESSPSTGAASDGDDGIGRGLVFGALLGAAIWVGLLQLSWWMLA